VTRALSYTLTALWLAIMLWAVLQFGRDSSAMATAGPIISALAPLLFVLGARRWAMVSERDPHPVMVSVIAGLGVVLAMVASTRFGEQYESHVVAAGLALAAWLIWVRWVWRDGPRASEGNSES